jgi:hypothetical protein
MSVLGKVEQFYAHAKQLTTVFQQAVTNTTSQTTKSFGRLWVAKSALYRWDYLTVTNRRGADEQDVCIRWHHAG